MEAVRERPRRSRPGQRTWPDVDRLSSPVSCSEASEQQSSTTSLPECSDTGGDTENLENSNCAPGSQSLASRSEPNKNIVYSDRYHELKQKLFEQKGKFINEKEKLEHEEELCAKQVSELFKNLRDILAVKEQEVMEKIDTEFNKKFEKVSDVISLIDSKTSDLNFIDSAGAYIDGTALHSIESGIEHRDDLHFSARDFDINEDVIDIVKSLVFGDFVGADSDSDSGEDTEADAVPDGAVARGRNSRSSVRVSTDLQHEDFDEESETPTNDPAALRMSGARDRDFSDDADTNSSDVFESESAEARVDDRGSVAASAPPLSGEEKSDDPPPYWQAIGLNHPEQSTATMPEIPGYHEIEHSIVAMPSNELELWHSFPIRRQYDRRTPLPAALVWNGEKICLADRANQRIKFFLPNGQIMTEMFLAGHEIYDVAFLEERNREARYLVTCPRMKTLIIISLNWNGQASIVRKFYSPYQYGCVSRGTVEQTLIGGDSNDRMGSASVDIFNFMGNVIKSFKFSPNYEGLMYPRSVEVYENFVIIMDWKLRAVMVFRHKGEAVGQYKGTPASPLVNPVDFTLDQFGNILTLDSELSNIHVIDLDCNPIEVIKIPRLFSDTAAPKLISFDTESKRLALARSNGDIAIFEFKNGYEGLPQRRQGHIPVTSDPMSPRQPAVLPLVEGMLPSTIENIVARPGRIRQRQFHL